MIAEVFINDKATVRPKLWENNFWIWHQDNVPAYNALSVKRFLAKNQTPVLQHPHIHYISLHATFSSFQH